MQQGNQEGEILRIQDLYVEYTSGNERVYAVNGVSLSLNYGETLGLVGETGAGKTTIAKSILRILPHPQAEITTGEILLDGENLLAADATKMRAIRGNRISMIFQDPMTSLNPIKRVGNQIADVIQIHQQVPKAEANERAVKLLERVGIPADRFREYPHQFSGGMKQRVVIAIALACNPDLLIADEPTSALDVTIQAQVMHLISELQKEYGTAVIMITHDFGIVAETCDKVAIIYAGQIVEYGTKRQVFKQPVHPYTKGLFQALPDIKLNPHRLNPIEGMPVDPIHLPKGCYFAPRCKYATKECHECPIDIEDIGDGHLCRCRYIE